MTVWNDLDNEALLSMLHLHFGIITGAIEPVKKPKAETKKPEKVIPFAEFSFLNAMVFLNTFPIAKERGILNPFEIAAGNEIMEMINA